MSVVKYPTWGAMPKQTKWHYWTELGETICGQTWLGGDLQLAPASLIGQKICSKCQRKYGQLAIQGKAVDK